MVSGFEPFVSGGETLSDHSEISARWEFALGI